MKIERIKPYLLQKKDIKVFNVDGCKYLYYTPKGQIFAVNNQYFKDYIEICLNNGLFNQGSLDIYIIEEIYNYFIETSNKCKSRYVVSDSKKDIDLSVIVLNIAGECNLSCDYCFAKTGDNFLFENMSIKTALRSVDFLIQSNPSKINYTISLFGGEPFLRLSMLEEFLKSVKQKYPQKSFFYTVTTNGTVLSDRHIKLVKEFNISILISIDGLEETTNKNRPFANGNANTFQTIIKNTERLRKNNINYSFRATIVAGDNDLVETAKFFEEQEVMYHFVFCFPTFNKTHSYAKWSDNNIEALKNQFKLLMDFYYNKIESKEFVYAEYVLKKIQKIALRKNTQVPCGAGNKLLAINADGTIYSCMNYSGLKETTVGNLDKGIDMERVKYYGAKHINALSCVNCNLRHLCGGACVAEKYTENGNPFKAVSDKCKIEGLTWTYYLALFQKIKNNHPMVIEEIVNNKLIYECA